MSDQAATDLQSEILDRYEAAVYEARLFRESSVELQMELDAATAALAVMTGQRDRAQQNLRHAHEKESQADPKLKALWEAADALLTLVQASGSRQSVATMGRAKNLKAALTAAHEHIDFIPF
jgi:hypothetical protein